MIIPSGTDYELARMSETVRQSEEWDDDIAPEVWNGVLSEECGEVCQAVLNGDLGHAREELIQIAAICERMWHSLGRRIEEGWQPSWPTEPRSKRATIGSNVMSKKPTRASEASEKDRITVLWTKGIAWYTDGTTLKYDVIKDEWVIEKRGPYADVALEQVRKWSIELK